MKALNPKTSFGISVLLGGESYMASIHTDSIDKLSLRKFSTEDALKPKKATSFSVCPEIQNNIDQWLTRERYGCLDNAGNIYLISDGTATKIGATTYNVRKRLNELQVGNANKLTVLGKYLVPRKISVERYLHEVYAIHHIRGEWFDLSQPQINEILATKPCPAKLNSHTNITNNESEQLTQSITHLQSLVNRHLSKVEIRGRNKIFQALFGNSGSFWSLNARQRKEVKSI